MLSAHLMTDLKRDGNIHKLHYPEQFKAISAGEFMSVLQNN